MSYLLGHILPGDEKNRDYSLSFVTRIASTLRTGEPLDDHYYYDTVVSAERGHECPVHKAVLCSCSNYFRAMFCGPMSTTSSKEGPSSRVSLPNSDKVVSAFVRFAYTGSIELEKLRSRHLVELLVLSDRLVAPDAAMLCERYMSKKIGRRNCIKIYTLTRTYFCPYLRDRARRYLLGRPVHTWTRSPGFADMSPGDLLELFGEDELNTREEEDVLRVAFRWMGVHPENRVKDLPMLIEAARLGLCERSYLAYMMDKNIYIRFNESLSNRFRDTVDFLGRWSDVSASCGPDNLVRIFRPRVPNKVIICIGGWMESGGISSRLEIYDPKTNRWIVSKYEDFGHPKAYHGLVRIDRTIYCLGGHDGNRVLSTVRAFNLDDSRWTSVAHMQSARCYGAFATLGKSIFACGGFDGYGRTDTCEVYDPASNTWTSISSMREKRSDASAASCGNAVFVAGGFNGVHRLNTVEMYKPERDLWISVEPMKFERSGFSLLHYKSVIIAVGGYDGHRRRNNVDCYDPKTNRWVSIATLKMGRNSFVAAIVDGVLYVSGGSSNGEHSESFSESLLLYDDQSPPRRRKIPEDIASLHGRRSAAAACVLEGPGLGKLINESIGEECFDEPNKKMDDDHEEMEM